ncbi:MAG TPA: hypothetical protein VF173_03855 [Thermoanaerobaculia bacterium]|nr:hypothetical protein [Thermoanaerobaculia bacterium]
MRTSKNQLLRQAVLWVLALFAFACGQSQEPAGQSATQTPQVAQVPAQTPAPPPAQPPVNELQPQPQSVQIPAQTPPTVAPGHDERAPLDSRERALAAREAEIAARERRLKQREQQARAGQSHPVPQPAPAPEPAAPAEPDNPEATAPGPASGPEPAEEPAPAPEPPAPPVEAPRTVNVTVPAGTSLDVALKDRLASNTSAVGDTFRVRVARDIRQDGVVAIPRGSELVGVVTEAVPLPRVGGQAKLGIKLTDLVLPSGSTVPVHASLVQQGRNETGRDAATIGGTAAGGAVLGRILSKGGGSKGTIIGAIIGALAGTAIASKTAGEEVVIPEGTVLGVRLDDAIEVRARARP